MCGIFGFVSKTRKPLRMSIIKRVAEVTMRRGPHAWGLAWVDTTGTMRTYKQSGRIVDSLGLLAMASDAVMLAGHCRYATHGDPANNLNNHPHDAGDAWVIHNGQIKHYRELAERHRLRRMTDCDSEVLGLMISKFKGDPLDRVKRAVDEAMNVWPLSMMALWPDRMIVARANNQPLSVGETSGGYYIASLQDGLPGTVSEMQNDEIVEYA